jgi:uncharacterized protein with FMN-binding domain
MDQSSAQTQQKYTKRTWIILLVVVILLGGLLAFAISKDFIANEIREGDTEESKELVSNTISADDSEESEGFGLNESWEDESEESEQPPKVAPVIQKNPSSSTPTSTPVVPSAPVATPPTTQKSAYKDGTFSATGTYVAPGGKEPIDITLVLKNDVVTSVTVGVKAKNSTSRNWQNYFVQAVNPAVAGMKLDAIRVDTVSGSSLTQIGFMDALAKIKSQAKM